MDGWWDDAPPHTNHTGPLPGPVGQEFKGPWLQQQIWFSCAIGCVSLLVFWVWKQRYPALYLGRYRQQGAALPYATIRSSLVRWVVPVLLYSDHSVLHTVGLDGAVALLFLKMGFAYFALLSVWSALVLMPVNYHANGWIDGVKKSEGLGKHHPNRTALPAELGAGGQGQPPLPYVPLPHMFTRDTLYELTHLVSTYVYVLLALYVLWRTYSVFIRFRQGHIQAQVHNVVTRTVELREIPSHLAMPDALRAYFAQLRMDVASVSILQDTRHLDALLLARIEALELQNLLEVAEADPAAAVAAAIAAAAVSTGAAVATTVSTVAVIAVRHLRC